MIKRAIGILITLGILLFIAWLGLLAMTDPAAFQNLLPQTIEKAASLWTQVQGILSLVFHWIQEILILLLGMARNLLDTLMGYVANLAQ